MFGKDEVKITDKMGLIPKSIRMQKGFSRELIAERAAIKAMVEALLYSREESSQADEANACAV